MKYVLVEYHNNTVVLNATDTRLNKFKVIEYGDFEEPTAKVLSRKEFRIFKTISNKIYKVYQNRQAILAKV